METERFSACQDDLPPQLQAWMPTALILAASSVGIETCEALCVNCEALQGRWKREIDNMTVRVKGSIASFGNGQQMPLLARRGSLSKVFAFEALWSPTGVPLGRRPDMKVLLGGKWTATHRPRQK